jgi:hypothetical protein
MGAAIDLILALMPASREELLETTTVIAEPVY